jgi:phospholipid/cholesterol/gamma-HCH transport system substrate-binding protein
MKPIAATWRLIVAGIMAVALVVAVINVITHPVASKVSSYTADFTDVAGLHVGADVRIRGVRVGKVDSVELHRRSEQTIAEVAFTLDSRYSVGMDTSLAVKYQALTGLRYVDVVNASDGVPAPSPVKHVTTSMTQPSFDITKLFNGLQPVFASLSPDDLNTFTSNVEVFLAGDGSGLRPVLDSINKLTRFVSNRQQVVATLLQNLNSVAESINGGAKNFIQIIEWANRPIDSALTVLDEFRKSQIYGPEFMDAVIKLLNSTGLEPTSDVDAALDRAFTNVDDTISAFKFIPVIWDNIPPPSQIGRPLECSRGRADLPLPVDILLNGQEVVLCKP